MCVLINIQLSHDIINQRAVAKRDSKIMNNINSNK